MRWVGDGTVRDLEFTAEEIERWEEEWDEEGFGVFAVKLLGSGELAGAVGLHPVDQPADLAGSVGICWRLGAQFWGQGYASEAAQATLEFALQDRGLDRVINLVRLDDTASANVSRKLGMVTEREISHPVHGYPVRVSSIDLSEYQA
ncbi:GNAT family N-acetyltransferase, partial [Streptomyces flavofungini]|uniref:GNAT family N-acetyltransferase n=1 Tax=Streptomyces flavofungini TaxID=68200 RepID=UPI0034DFB860